MTKFHVHKMYKKVSFRSLFFQIINDSILCWKYTCTDEPSSLIHSQFIFFLLTVEILSLFYLHLIRFMDFCPICYRKYKICTI